MQHLRLSLRSMTVVPSLRAADLASRNAQSQRFQRRKALLADLESSQQSRDYGLTSKRLGGTP